MLVVCVTKSFISTPLFENLGKRFGDGQRFLENCF